MQAHPEEQDPWPTCLPPSCGVLYSPNEALPEQPGHDLYEAEAGLLVS
jgi:hypothetical protein